MTAAGLVLALGAVGCKEAKAPAPGARGALKPQETCPVMGGKIDKSFCTIYKDRCVFFCSAMCPEKFKKDPEKYIKKLEAQGVELADKSACELHKKHGGAAEGHEGARGHEAAMKMKMKVKVQVTCPVMGDRIDKSIYADHGGKRVYFCCDMCPEKFKKDPEKYLKILSDKGEIPADAPMHGHMH